MRIVRYEDPVDGIAVDLHPRITILGGLSDAARQRLTAAVAAIPAGEDPGVGGSVEVHGVFLDLSRESLDLLELHEPLDVTVHSADLPQRAVPTDGDGTDPALDARVHQLDAARRSADEHLAAVESDRVAVSRRLADLAARRREIAADVEAARVGVDSAAPSRLLRARGELESLQRRSTAVAIEEITARRHLLETQLEALIGEADQQRRELKRLAASGTEELREALAAATAAHDPDLIPSVEAASLAERLDALDETVGRLDASAATGRAQLQDLTARRDRAYDSLISTEAALRTPDLDPAVVEELESTHDEIFELDGRVSKLSSSRLRRRMNELRERERELLSLLGFDTWSSYVMGMSNDGAEAERQQRYEVAKATYQFAEDELAKAASAALEVVGELADRQDERDQALARAAELLGEAAPDDAGLRAALRSLQVPAEPVTVDVDAALSHLRAELVARGAESLPTGRQALLDAAHRWLEVADESANARIREIEATRLHIESEITRIAADLEALPDTTRPGSLPADDPRLIDAAAAVTREEELVARHRDAQRLLDELRALDQVLRGDEERLESELATVDHAAREAERAAAVATDAARRAADELDRAAAAPRRGRARADRQTTIDRVEWYLLSRLAQQRSVSFVGSVPLVLDEAFVEWPIEELAAVLERLVRMSEVIQMILLTDDVGMVGWARDLGRDHAAVIDLEPVG